MFLSGNQCADGALRTLGDSGKIQYILPSAQADGIEMSTLTLSSDPLGIIILDVITSRITAHEKVPLKTLRKKKDVLSILCCDMASMFSLFNGLCALEV